MLIAEKQPFKGVENYFTDALLYRDSFETTESPLPEDDSGNEADVEPEPEEECLWELNVMGINKPDLNNTADDEGEWFINENLDLTYFSTVGTFTNRYPY